ncbi:hypothetical protein I4U23_023146 [Adineta vaga]|nr:hypothetical protein I4U23_023146 [Adineta vaga]
MNEQTKLPLKLRYKPVSILHLLQLLIGEGQLLYTNNRDFIDLVADDHSILLENTMIYTTATLANFINSQIGIMDLPVFYEAVGIISNPGSISVMKRIAARIISDNVVMKLCLAIMSFSTDSSKTFSNMKKILTIQDKYIELTWRYLIFIYKLEWTVKCFSDIIRFLFTIHAGIVRSKQVEWYRDTVDSVTQQTKETLTLSE